MATFCEGPDVRITENLVETWLPTHRRFATAELSDLSAVKCPHRRLTVVSANVTVGATAFVMANAPRFDSAGDWLAAGVLVAIAALSTWVCFVANPREYRIVARYRGRPVVLYATCSRQRFGQVRRALVRAGEYTAELHQWIMSDVDGL